MEQLCSIGELALILGVAIKWALSPILLDRPRGYL